LELFEAIKSRACVRSFTDEDVPDETIGNLLEAAIRAPTAGGIQPWRFFVVKGGGMKEKLAAAAFGQSFVSQAPVVVVACADLDVCSRGYGSRGENLYAIQDTAAAVQNILLAVVAEGLGACWVGAFDEGAASRALSLPPRTRPLAMVPVGRPTRITRPTGREPFETLTTKL
jgi:nitroreductase